MAVWLYLARNPDSQMLILGLAAVVAGALGFVRGILHLREKRLIENIPTAKVRSASLGLVELQGTATGPYTLTAPLSAEPCFYYRTVVSRRQGSDREWKVVHDRAERVLFYLEDETGRMMIDLNGAEIELPLNYENEGSMGDEAGNIMAAPFNLVTARYADHALGYTWHRVEEYCIKPGDSLYALGTIVENPGVQLTQPIDLPPPSLWRLGVGKFVDAVHPPSPAAAAPASGFDLKPAVLMMRSQFEKHFLISYRSERTMLQQWTWDVVVYAWGGPLLALVGVAIIVWQLGVF